MTSNRADSIHDINSKYRGSPERPTSNYYTNPPTTYGVGGGAIVDTRTSVGQPVRATTSTYNAAPPVTTTNFTRPSVNHVDSYPTGPVTTAPVTTISPTVNRADGGASPRTNISTGTKQGGVSGTNASTPNQKGPCGCPLWLWILLGLLFLAGLATGLILFFTRGKSDDSNTVKVEQAAPPHVLEPVVYADPKAKTVTNKTTNATSNGTATDNTTSSELVCPAEFHIYNGKCLKCPDPSSWNGTNCIIKKKAATTTNTTKVKGADTASTANTTDATAAKAATTEKTSATKSAKTTNTTAKTNSTAGAATKATTNKTTKSRNITAKTAHYFKSIKPKPRRHLSQSAY